MPKIPGILFFALSVCCTAGLGQHGRDATTTASAVHIETVVKPLPEEDIAADCRYDLTLAEPAQKVRGVWVIFDRGRDIHDLSADPKVVQFLRQFHLAMLLHGHCPGKLESDHGDMNMDPLRGLGPALFRSLDQFARMSDHPELSNAKLILLGFSGAGVLSARFVAEYPQRIIAAVLASPGHYPPFGIDIVNLGREAQSVPQMVAAAGADEVSGTQRPYEYFVKYRRLGAPLTFVLQNHTPHCCTANLKEIMLDWLGYILRARLSRYGDEPLRPLDQRSSRLGSFRLVPTSTRDSYGLRTYNLQQAAISARKLPGRMGGEVTSWLPTKPIAEEWLAFVTQSSHPLLPLR